MEYSFNHGLTSCVANWIVKAVSGFNSDKLDEYEFKPAKVNVKCEIEIPMLDKFIRFKNY